MAPHTSALASPISPPKSESPLPSRIAPRSRAMSNVVAASRSLQSILGSPAPSSSCAGSIYADAVPRTLPSPPQLHSTPPPRHHIRRSTILTRRHEELNKAIGNHATKDKGSGTSLRPNNKRRRDSAGGFTSPDDEGRESTGALPSAPKKHKKLYTQPRTPSPATSGPPEVPRGLCRRDFLDNQQSGGASSPAMDDEGDASTPWTEETDRLLVDFVLASAGLSRSQWEECARRLGGPGPQWASDRWRGLLDQGCVGVKRPVDASRAHRVVRRETPATS